jgi:GWxTD domain-containing protein
MLTLRWKFALILITVVFILASDVLQAASTKTSQLPEVYRNWLNEEVNYLITDAERDALLQLKTNQNRDTFIANFWKIRNPDPTTPSNEAKDEHYRRLVYANEQFGFRGADNGWRTDRGMVYITLGFRTALWVRRAQLDS